MQCNEIENAVSFFKACKESHENKKTKTMKLLYYAHAFSLALDDKPLFKDQFLKWKLGPVIQSVYEGFDRMNIDDGKIHYDKIQISETERFLALVDDFFAKYSRQQLIDMTHEEDPWKKAEKDKIISDKEIQNYFKKYELTEKFKKFREESEEKDRKLKELLDKLPSDWFEDD